MAFCEYLRLFNTCLNSHILNNRLNKSSLHVSSSSVINSLTGTPVKRDPEVFFVYLFTICNLWMASD